MMLQDSWYNGIPEVRSSDFLNFNLETFGLPSGEI